MHEIITLQLGQRANYLGTHFWNSQESYFTYNATEESIVDHDIHFRPGLGAEGTETFTPRTVIYDLKGGFGSLKKINALYELEEEGVPQPLWNGPSIIQRQTLIEQSAYQQSLETGEKPPLLTTDSVRYWSDFNRVYFHPRSIVQLNDYELNSSLMPFEKWPIGEELFHNLEKEHDLLDRDLRPFAEEADHMQGIQMMTSLDDAWGGFAAQYLDRIRDEYGKTTVWVWGLEDSHHNTPRDKKFLKLSNTARSIAEMAPQASLLIPITVPSTTLPPYVNLDRRSAWHNSALLSTAQESVTLSSRLKPRHGIRQSLDELAAALNVNGNQNIAKLQMGVKEKQIPEQSDGDERNGRLALREASRDVRIPSQDGRAAVVSNSEDEERVYDINFFSSDEPNVRRGQFSHKKTHVFGETDCYRGEDTEEDEESHDLDGRERARRRAAGLSIVHKSRTPLSYSILDSFPQIYSSPSTGRPQTSISVRTSLSTDSTVALRLKNIRTIVSRSIGVEEREALTNSLGEIAEGYEEGWDSGSDSDDD